MRLFFGHSSLAAQITGQQPGYSKSRHSPAVSKNLGGVEDTKGTYSDGAAKQTPQFYL